MDLTTKLQTTLAKCAESEYKANLAENDKQNCFDLFENKCKEAKELEDKIDSLENTLINLNEALANARKEIARMQNENSSLNEKNKSIYEMYQNLLLEERRESSMSHEINSLNNKIQYLNIEKDNLYRAVRSQNIQDKTNEYALNIRKIADEKENALRQTENNMNKLINENADLKRRLNLEENTKMKLNDIVKKKKAKINKFKRRIKKL